MNCCFICLKLWSLGAFFLVIDFSGNWQALTLGNVLIQMNQLDYWSLKNHLFQSFFTANIILDTVFLFSKQPWMTKASGRRGQSPDFWWPPPLTHQPLCVNFLWQHLWAIGLWQNRGLNALAIFLPWTWKYLVKVVSPSEQKNPQLNRIGVIDSNVVQLASILQYLTCLLVIKFFNWATLHSMCKNG